MEKKTCLSSRNEEGAFQREEAVEKDAKDTARKQENSRSEFQTKVQQKKNNKKRE